jgi:hypothetical protein
VRAGARRAGGKRRRRGDEAVLIALAIDVLAEDLSGVVQVLRKQPADRKTGAHRAGVVTGHVDQLEAMGRVADVGVVSDEIGGSTANSGGDHALVVDPPGESRQVVDAEVADLAPLHRIRRCRGEEEAPLPSGERDAVRDQAADDATRSVLTVRNRKERIDRIDRHEPRCHGVVDKPHDALHRFEHAVVGISDHQPIGVQGVGIANGPRVGAQTFGRRPRHRRGRGREEAIGAFLQNETA